MLNDSGQAGDLRTEEVSNILYPYLRAWTDEADLGRADFDDCATVEELSRLLASKVLAHLTRA